MNAIWGRVRAFFARSAVMREIDDELGFHLEQATAANVAKGMSPDEAAREARRKFGNFQTLREDCRQARGAAWGEGLKQDLLFGIRMLLRNPGFTSIATMTLALGVAGNIVIFTIYNSLYVRPLPFIEADRLVDLDERAPQWNLEYTGLAFPDFHTWREQNRAFISMGAWAHTICNVAFDGVLDHSNGNRVTHDVATTLRIKPSLGRLFRPEEDQPGAPKVVMLGYGYWKRQFGGQEDVIGKSLLLDNEPFTIVGVLPKDEQLLLESDFWVPLCMDPNDRGQGWFLRGVGRLKPGVTLAQAREDLQRVHRGLVEAHLTEAKASPRVGWLRDRYFGPSRSMIQMMLCAVGLVLLIACGNMAALMLARGLARTHELALRLSLGATRGRLACLVACESLLVAASGGSIGFLLGCYGLRVLVTRLNPGLPRWLSLESDWRVWLFACAMVLLAAVLSALPLVSAILNMDRPGWIQSSARQSMDRSTGRQGLQWLVVGEIALTFILMTQAGLVLRTFRALQHFDPGFRADHVLAYSLSLPKAKYPSVRTQEDFCLEHLEQIRHMPGVEAASAATFTPLQGHTGTLYQVEDAPPPRPEDPQPVVLQRSVFPDYFRALGITLLAGRSFTAKDGRDASSQVVIVDEAFAKRSWPNADPLGKRIRQGSGDWLTVVGVARDVKHYGVDQKGHAGVYVPFVHRPNNTISVVTRTRVPPLSLVPGIRESLRQADPDLPIFDVTTMSERLANSMTSRRISASLFTLFSGLALIMAVGGLYGVFSYVVSRRAQEIGVRIALGARRSDVLWLVIRQGLLLAMFGIGIGLLVILALTPLTSHLVFNVHPLDPVTLAGVALLLTLIALAACCVPATRAARLDPLRCLKAE